MKVLILGGLGMLGHRLYLTLKTSHNTRFTLRKAKSEQELGFLSSEEGHFYEDVDLSNTKKLESIFEEFNPDVVINCVGIIQNSILEKKPEIAYEINSVVPHKLAAMSQEHGFRLIHISTDCIFDGNDGNYTETSEVRPIGTYAKSKQLGEVDYLSSVLTIRTSIIGRELGESKSLVEWFLKESEVGGYENVFFSGLPTLTLSKVIENEILRNSSLWGLLHISSNPISKLNLLELINQEYSLNKKINPTKGPDLNRHLNSDFFNNITGRTLPDWENLVKDLLLTDSLYLK